MIFDMAVGVSIAQVDCRCLLSEEEGNDECVELAMDEDEASLMNTSAHAIPRTVEWIGDSRAHYSVQIHLRHLMQITK